MLMNDEISKSEPMKVINNNPNSSNSSLLLQVTVSTEPLQQSSLHVQHQQTAVMT